jgi:predicted RNase H-like HicB family nuclease
LILLQNQLSYGIIFIQYKKTNPPLTREKYQMAKEYNLIIEKDEDGWYISEVIELPGCHTQAKSIDELIERTKEAIKAYLETEAEPEVSSQFIGVQRVEV